MTAPPAALCGSRPPDGVTVLINRGFPSNTYLVETAEPGTCVVVDPGLDADLILDALAERDLRPLAILATHGHFDHIGAAEPLRRRYRIPFLLHPDDRKIARQANFLMAMCRIPVRIDVAEPDHAEPHDKPLSLGGRTFGFRGLPGHTPGSRLILIDGAAFTGDTLYRRGMDEARLPGAEPDRLRAGLLALWGELPEETWIFPGHGRGAPFGDIKRGNAKLRTFLGLDAPS